MLANLETDTLCLKPLSLNELNGNYVNWLNDPVVCRYNSHGDILYTKEMAADFINTVTSDKTKEVYAVYLKENNLHIGNISLQKIDLKNKNAEIAFLFGEKECWGQGFAKQSAKLLLKRAFEDLKLHRIYFGTHIENIAMQKLGEGLGFKKEGVLRQAQFKNGKFNDITIYSILQG